MAKKVVKKATKGRKPNKNTMVSKVKKLLKSKRKKKR